MNIDKMVKEVRNIAYEVHLYLGNGYLEKVYENCLKHRLEKAGYEVEAQKNLKVFDEDGFEIGDYFADLVVNKCLIIELKSVKRLSGEHYAQTLNYLKITGYEKALLINFGSYRFETRTVVPNFGGIRRTKGDSRVDVERCRNGAADQQLHSGLPVSPSTPLHGQFSRASGELPSPSFPDGVASDSRVDVERCRNGAAGQQLHSCLPVSPSTPLHG